MARIKYEIAAAFARRQPAKDSSAFRSTGDAIYSYSMRLAHWDGAGDDARIVFDYPGRGVGGYKAPSATTNTHMIALEAVIVMAGPAEVGGIHPDGLASPEMIAYADMMAARR